MVKKKIDLLKNGRYPSKTDQRACTASLHLHWISVRFYEMGDN